MINVDSDNNLFVNNTIIGCLRQEVDGFYQFYPEHHPASVGTYIPSYILRGIAKIVDDKNAPWQKEIDDYFAEQKEGHRYA